MSGHDPTFQGASTASSQPGSSQPGSSQPGSWQPGSWQPGERAVPVPARPDYTVTPPPVRAPSSSPPPAVRLSFWLWLASFAVGLLVIVYSLSQFNELHQRLADGVLAQRPNIKGDLVNRAVDLTLYIGWGGITALILMQLLLAVLMRTRRNWARVLLALLAAVGVVGTVFSLVTIAEEARLVLPLQALLIVVATVLMFLPGTNTWFRQRAA